MDNKKLANMCLILPTLRELEKKTASTKNAKKRTILQTLGILLQKISFKYCNFTLVS